jgi:putative membrane protein
MQPQERRSGIHWLWVGLAVMFILIGVGVFISSITRTSPTYSPPFMMQFPFGFGWIWPIFGIIFFVWIFGWAFSWVWWPSRRYYRRRYWYGDDAREILRQRYARGEITKDQFEQMMRDLEQHA